MMEDKDKRVSCHMMKSRQERVFRVTMLIEVTSQLVRPSAPMVQCIGGIRNPRVPTFVESSNSESDSDLPNKEEALEVPLIDQTIALDLKVESWLGTTESECWISLVEEATIVVEQGEIVLA